MIDLSNATWTRTGVPAAPVRRVASWLCRRHGLRHTTIGRSYDPLLAADGASDRELQRLAGPLGRLDVEDVRWDVIGAAHSGRRHRI
jgi:hypothetical protein